MELRRRLLAVLVALPVISASSNGTKFNNTGIRLQIATCQTIQWNLTTNSECDTANWTTTDVTNMSYLFANDPVFNGNVSTWKVLSVKTFEGMFKNATAFNQPILDWNMDAVTTLESMFEGATAFNSAFAVARISPSFTSMARMFKGATSFNQPLQRRFYTNDWQYEPLKLFYCDDLSHMFEDAVAFNQPLVEFVGIGPNNLQNIHGFGQNFESMFEGAISFNSVVSWRYSEFEAQGSAVYPTNMARMFAFATAFNQPFSIPTGVVTNMSGMFAGASSFNQDISNWDVSSVTDMSSMFDGSAEFNVDINCWDVSSVQDMSAMFRRNASANATLYNHSLHCWDTSAVTDTSEMFKGQMTVGEFESWRMGRVQNATDMFRDADFSQLCTCPNFLDDLTTQHLCLSTSVKCTETVACTQACPQRQYSIDEDTKPPTQPTMAGVPLVLATTLRIVQTV